MGTVLVRRLRAGDRALAGQLFAVMADVFGESDESLSDGYIDGLLARESFWAMAALDDGEIVGGLTAHALPMTRAESAELFIYDVAVRADRQREGIGRRLVDALRDSAADAGIDSVFVAADTPDTHALEFYRSIGGEPAPVTMFTFPADSGRR